MSTRIQDIPVKMASKEDKPQKLVRTSSIEKIRRFNSYLCTQHYYVIPAILAWLRSSQEILHRSAEKTILNFRSIIINAVFHRLINLDYKSISYRTVSEEIKNVFEQLNVNMQEAYLHYQIEKKFLKCLVYMTVVILTCQLSYCVFVIFSSKVPYGLAFLMGCSVYIIIVYSRATFFFLSKKSRSIGCNNKLKTK